MPSPTVMKHNEYKLVQKIVTMSVADDWPSARGEWELVSVFFADRACPGTCLCGHFPIIEHCVLRNRLSGKETIVGNVCVGKFIGLPSGSIFDSLRRIAANRSRAVSAETIAFAQSNGWLSSWEEEFYRNTRHKRRLTERQLSKRIEINEALLVNASLVAGRAA